MSQQGPSAISDVRQRSGGIASWAMMPRCPNAHKSVVIVTPGDVGNLRRLTPPRAAGAVHEQDQNWETAADPNPLATEPAKIVRAHAFGRHPRSSGPVFVSTAKFGAVEYDYSCRSAVIGSTAAARRAGRRRHAMTAVSVTTRTTAPKRHGIQCTDARADSRVHSQPRGVGESSATGPRSKG